MLDPVSMVSDLDRDLILIGSQWWQCLMVARRKEDVVNDGVGFVQSMINVDDRLVGSVEEVDLCSRSWIVCPGEDDEVVGVDYDGA